MVIQGEVRKYNEKETKRVQLNERQQEKEAREAGKKEMTAWGSAVCGRKEGVQESENTDRQSQRERAEEESGQVATKLVVCEGV